MRNLRDEIRIVPIQAIMEETRVDHWHADREVRDQVVSIGVRLWSGSTSGVNAAVKEILADDEK